MRYKSECVITAKSVTVIAVTSVNVLLIFLTPHLNFKHVYSDHIKSLISSTNVLDISVI